MKVWTNYEIDFLKKNYKKLKYAEIAKKLNRTESSIWGECFRLKLNKGYHNLWNEQKVIEKLNEISRKLGRAPSAREVSISILKACERYFGSFNNAKKAAKLGIRLNLNFLPKESFKPSKELAYIIGAIIGDGNIRIQKSKQRTSYVISFATIDEDFMNKFVNDFFMWSNYRPFVKLISGGYKKFPSGKFYNYNKFFSTQIPFKEACLLLEKFKSDPQYCLKYLPKRYWRWVIKGLWDSEGSISMKERKYLRILFTNYNKNVIRLFRKVLEEFSVPNSLQKYKKNYPLVEILTNEGKLKFINLMGGVTIKRKIPSAVRSKLSEINVQYDQQSI